MRLPPVTAIETRDTHRLVPSRYSPRGESVLVRIADPGDDAHLAAIFELDARPTTACWPSAACCRASAPTSSSSRCRSRR